MLLLEVAAQTSPFAVYSNIPCDGDEEGDEEGSGRRASPKEGDEEGEGHQEEVIDSS